MSRNEACATLEVLVASVVLASQLPRMQRVTCDNSLLTMVHTLSSLPPDEQQLGESREKRGASNRETGRSVFAHSKGEARGETCGSGGGRKKMI
jgi:hypothetical protein